jgi:lipid-A-disaccharide synthase
MHDFTLFIQTNSPGELSCWVKPFIKAFHKANPLSKIIILLTPCQYASGQEYEIASCIPYVTQVYQPAQTFKLLFSLPWFKKIHQHGAILYLGGDPLYSQLFSLKYRLPALAYTEHKKTPGKLFKKVFYKHLDGDLMTRRIQDFHPNTLAIQKKYHLSSQDHCLFFCGSRPEHFSNLLPIFTDIVHHIKQKLPHFSAIIAVSPFISDQLLAKIQTSYNLQDLTIIKHADSLELIHISKFIVTIPGTNTAEAMYLHKPMLVLIPLNKPKALIFDGLKGLLIRTPLLGTLIIKIALWLLKKKKHPPLYAHPNLLAKKQIVPEYMDYLTPETTAQLILDYYLNPQKLSLMQQQLANIPFKTGVSQKIIAALKLP